MEETMLKSEALSLAQQNMLAYFQTHDVKYIAEDGVFRNMSTGETYHGRAEIGAMLHYVYHVAFDAKMEITSYAITEDRAVLEGVIKGKHIGEIEGIPATGKDISLPTCVTYLLKDGLIQEAHIFPQNDVLMKQLGAKQAAFNQKTTFLVRDIFHLKFGQFKAAKQLLNEALEKKLMPDNIQTRVLTDFTGDAYRLVFEEGFDSLSDYESSLTGSMRTEEWQAWYEQFKPLVERSHREILKQIF
ncbi:MAG TPA: ester cyclase [Flavisolibacter sp.]|nr:ester cyclase [Flavisolibacter sp.]